jgi:hypothetical protein
MEGIMRKLFYVPAAILLMAGPALAQTSSSSTTTTTVTSPPAQILVPPPPAMIPPPPPAPVQSSSSYESHTVTNSGDGSSQSVTKRSDDTIDADGVRRSTSTTTEHTEN